MVALGQAKRPSFLRKVSYLEMTEYRIDLCELLAPSNRVLWNDYDQIIRFDRDNQKNLSNRTRSTDEKGEHSVCDCSFTCPSTA